jgi:hypothetical protein
MRAERVTKTETIYSVMMAFVLSVSHINAFNAFGATFWIDSLAYVSLGDSLFDPAKLTGFYDGIGCWLYSHLGAGLPFLWFLVTFFPLSWQWPFLAIFQHLIAACSCWLAFGWAARPGALSLCGVTLLSFLPFYQAGHQMLMTESLSASLVLIATALTIRLTTRQWSEPVFWVLLIVLFFVVQFRSYFGMIVVALAACTLLWTGKWRSTRTILLVAVFGISVLIFPAYRFFSTGKFFMPSLGCNTLLLSLRADAQPSSRLVPAFERADLPRNYSASDVLTKGLDYTDIIQIAEYWRASGLSDAQINRRANNLAAWLLQDGIRPTINRVLYGLNSCGFLFPYRVGPTSYQVARGKSMGVEWKFQVDYYRWFSWIDSTDYQNSYDYFFRTSQPHIPSSGQSQKEMIATLEHYVKPKTVYLRDPLLLGVLPLDLWCSFGLIGIVLLAARNSYKVATLLIIPVAINFVITAASALPNVRYAYALIPIYFLAVVAGLEALRSRRVAKPRFKSALEP